MAETEKRNKNAGFSLVELIVVVSILAIASVPLIKSLSMASKTNAKAQSIQNATSLGEKIMEEMKSTSIADIKKKYGPSPGTGQLTENANGYEIKLPGVNATQGEKFDVIVTIDKFNYSGNSFYDKTDSDTARKTNVKSANTLRLPSVASIDTMSQAVLTSKKEFNKYDTEAVNYFNQKIADYPDHKARIVSKTIDITKSVLTGSNYGVTVKATVKYVGNSKDAEGNVKEYEYIRDLYTGSFVQQEKSNGTPKPMDSNIYIFYTVGKVTDAKETDYTTAAERELRETINITDTGDYSAFADTNIPHACHKVYFIGQIPGDSVGPQILINGNTVFDDYSDLPAIPATPTPVPTPPVSDGTFVDGNTTLGNVRFISNLTSAGAKGSIYEDEVRIRVYDITVKLYKGSDPIFSLNSTVSASDQTPTPTPP